MKKNLLAFTLLMLATGCGQSAYNENASVAGGAAPSASGGGYPNSPSTTPSSTGSSSSSTSNPALADPYRFTFKIAGSTTPPPGSTRPAATSQTITGIFTDNKLQITVGGGDPGAVGNTGYTAAFSCLRVNVTVLGQTQTAFVSNTGAPGWGYCSGAQPTQTLDFTSRVTQGHQAVTIKIDSPMYDNCRLYGNIYSYGCPMTAVYWNHIVNGSIEVHTNGTN
jgi:hypothetical protein